MKNIFKLLIFGIIFTFSFLKSNAQNFDLIIQATDSSSIEVLKSISYNKVHISKESALREVDSISNKLSTIGYINNQYEISQKETFIICMFSLNKKIDLIRIFYPENAIEKDFLNQISIKCENNYFDIPLNWTEDTLEKIVTHFENSGHTFTNISLSKISQDKNILTAHLNLSISKKRTINNVIIKGYPEFPKKYLKHYLNINPNTTFNLNSLNELNDLINTIPFVQQIKKPEVLFTKDSTTLYLYLKKKSTSNFDGIIGFSNEDSGNLKFNGYLDLQLNNILNKGESFGINWENSQKDNSSLKLNLGSTYIFKSKLAFHGRFSIFRQDSTYVNIKSEIELGYLLNRNNSINMIGTREKSELSSNSSETNSINDFTKNMLGVSYQFHILDKPIYINRYKFIANGSYFIGNRKADGIKTEQNNIQFYLAYTARFNSRNSILLKTSTKLMNAPTPLLNELFRIGGINSIRGFNENSILTPKYNVTNIEYHYTVNFKSYIYSITDFAILTDINTNKTTQLYGLGLGYYLNTKHTILNMSYALGKSYNTPFDFNNSKIHIKIQYPF